jgi:hypothetical protein
LLTDGARNAAGITFLVFIPISCYVQASIRDWSPGMAKSPRSEAQRAASRANGRKSSGPRTSAGKGRSRRNALKHGLRAGSLAILPTDVDAPSLSLAAAVHDRLAPADVIEIELTEGIALAYWRLRRARQLEEALIEGRLDAVAPNTLARFLLRRSNVIDALGLLLRYRNQALGELARLGRLLEQHRRPASPSAGPPEPGAPSTPLPPAGATAAALRSGRNRPANDNHDGDAGHRAAVDQAALPPEHDGAVELSLEGDDAVALLPPTPGWTVS